MNPLIPDQSNPLVPPKQPEGAASPSPQNPLGASLDPLNPGPLDSQGAPPANQTRVKGTETVGQPMGGSDRVTPSGQPIPPQGATRTVLAPPDPSPQPTLARKPNSQEVVQHASPEAVRLVEEQRRLAREKSATPPFPLRPGDVIQGPGDRRNRLASEDEVSAGKHVYHDDYTPEELEALEQQQFDVIDPPIDESAPEDKPANPRAVAEGRGIKFPSKEKVS